MLCLHVFDGICFFGLYGTLEKGGGGGGETSGFVTMDFLLPGVLEHSKTFKL